MPRMWRYDVGGRTAEGTTMDMVTDLWIAHGLDREFADCVDERFGSASDLWGYLTGGRDPAVAMDRLACDVLASLRDYVEDCFTDRFETASGAVATEIVEGE